MTSQSLISLFIPFLTFSTNLGYTPDISSKIIICNSKIFFLSKNAAYPYIFVSNDNIFKKNNFPIIWKYDSFTHIESAWDVDDSIMWGVHCGHIIMENSWLGYVSSSLLKIPLKDTITWNHSKRITNKDSLISLSFSYEASSKVPLAEQLVEKYSIRALVSRNKKIIDFRKIKDSLIANTYFNFMLSSKNEPIYFLLTEGQFSTWKIRKGKYGMGWQVDRKFSLLKFVKFHCFERDNKLYILTNEGIMYRVDKRKLKKIKEIAFKNFNDQILIVDKDKNQVKLLDKNLMDSSEDLANTISTKSISLF